MRTLLTIVIVLGLAGVAAAYDLGSQAPVKSPASYPENVPNPQRQGGDTIATAFVMPYLLFSDTGTTVGYNNDYDAVCPYTGSTAPDVVYQLTLTSEHWVAIDLCGSSFDTKLYVFDADLNLVACNDDYYTDAYCGLYVSHLEGVLIQPGSPYYIVVDGYGGAAGDYVFNVFEYVPCELACPAGGFPEGEPPIVDGYIDEYNSGCGGATLPFQSLTGGTDGALTLCGVTGWYGVQGSEYRDTDWFILTAGADGSIEVVADAEYATYLFELTPQDCATVGVAQQMTAGPCAESSLTITGYASEAPVWFWAGPTVFVPPAGAEGEYDYIVWFSGLAPGPIATEAMTWGAVKALYD